MYIIKGKFFLIWVKNLYRGNLGKIFRCVYVTKFFPLKFKEELILMKLVQIQGIKYEGDKK